MGLHLAAGTLRAPAAGLVAFLFVLTASAAADAEVRRAPEWEISEWINGSGVSIDQLKGKVVIVEFFQLWCPGCNRFSIPLMKKWHEKTFADAIRSNRLFMVSIHTVFEGHDHQNPQRLRSFVKQKGIHHLVGVDRHRNGDPIPETMKKYDTRGTPEMAIIDKAGNIRFQWFGGFNPALVESLIRRLLDEPVREGTSK